MSPGFSSQWNSSQPAWNTYTFPRASLHYQSHASYTYCAGHPAVSNYNLFCSYLNELCDSLGGGGARGLTVRHTSPALFVSHGSQDSSCVLTITLENIRMGLRRKQMWKFHGSVEIHIFCTFSNPSSCMKLWNCVPGFQCQGCGLESSIIDGFFSVSSESVRWMNYSFYFRDFKLYGWVSEGEHLFSSLDLLIFTTLSLMWSVVNMQSCC